MKRQLALVLILFGSSWLLTQKLTAAEALAVASNGKWAVEWTYSASVSEASEKAIAACRANGGTDPKVVWSTWGSGARTHWAIVKGAVAVSDNGTGTIVGWCFNNFQNHKRARIDCRKKGGQNPKIVDIGK